LNHYHPRGVQIIKAYVDGVNAYIKQINTTPELLPIEFKLLGITPKEWTPEVVISRHQGLLGNITQELSLGIAVNDLGEAKVKDIMSFHPKQPNLHIDSTIDGSILNPAILELYNAYRKEVSFNKSDLLEVDEDAVQSDPFQLTQEKEGSNNWIISSQKSYSGFPLLANDPHRKVAVPSLRYIVHLVAPGWNVIGGGEPEIPGVSIGHNEYGAWGLTIFETDGEDLFVYKTNPKNNLQYWYKGEWVNMKSIKDSILIKGGKKKYVTYYYTNHGPVTFIDSAHQVAYAVKAAWLEPGGAPYLASLRIDQSKTWEEFRNACTYSHIPGENMIWADKKGNTGWQAVGIVPIRKNFSGYVPIPGDGRFEWQGYLPIKERPHLLNPSNGFLATANQNVTPEDYTRWDAIGYTWADPYRGNRINQVLSSKEKVSMEDMAALQNDYYCIPAGQLVPMLSTMVVKDSLCIKALDSLQLWNFVLDKKSVAAGIFVAWEKELVTEVNGIFVPEKYKGMLKMQLTKIIERLQHPENYFGDPAIQKRNELIEKCFVSAVKNLQKRFGNDMNNWMYGQPGYKHITMEHDLSYLAPSSLKRLLNIGPLPRGGNGQAPGSTGDYDNQQSGASFRILIDTKNWDAAKMINTPGQSGDPNSPFYKNLFPIWANDQYFPAYYSKNLIQQVTVEAVTLLPSK
jgi:penicillin amidase